FFGNAEDGSGRNIPKEWGWDGTSALPFTSLRVLRLYSNILTGEIPAEIVNHPNWSQWWNASGSANTYILPQRGLGGGLTLP
ncbi:MAG: hypothetical protein FWD56_05425, partial [Bacteroidales bacterium]|nr:hypothetical protein [Bacteroidales bacterium]